jgi:hypothetical protein
MRIWIGLVVALASISSGCGGPAVGGSQMVVLAPKPPDCPLELVTIHPEDMAPGGRFGAGGQYQMIGVVALGLDQGTNPMSPEVRKLVRPRACAYGGEVVSLLATGDSQHAGQFRAQTDVVFTVWGPRTSSGPQPF